MKKDNDNPTIYNVNTKSFTRFFKNNSYVATKFIKEYSFITNKINSFNVKFIFPLNSNNITSRQSVRMVLQCMLLENKKDDRKQTIGESDYDSVGLLRKMGFYRVDKESKTSCLINSMNNTSSKSKFEIHSKPIKTKLDFFARDIIDAYELFNLIRTIQDPEHPLTLEQLHVVKQELIEVKDDQENISSINIKFVPTIPHCSMATLIGLTIRVKLLRSVASRFKVSVMIEPGTHVSENAINQQLNDKERVIAALENDNLLDVVNKCISHN